MVVAVRAQVAAEQVAAAVTEEVAKGVDSLVRVVVVAKAPARVVVMIPALTLSGARRGGMSTPCCDRPTRPSFCVVAVWTFAPCKSRAARLPRVTDSA